MTKRRKAAWVRSRGTIAVLVLVAAGCTVLPGDKPLPRLFVLTPKSTFDTDIPTVDWQLTVSKPVAEAGLNTARIARIFRPCQLDRHRADHGPDADYRELREHRQDHRRRPPVGGVARRLQPDDRAARVPGRI